jgi:hypothetical protein
MTAWAERPRVIDYNYRSGINRFDVGDSEFFRTVSVIEKDIAAGHRQIAGDLNVSKKQTCQSFCVILTCDSCMIDAVTDSPDARPAFCACPNHPITIGRDAVHGHVTFPVRNPADTRTTFCALAHHAVTVGRDGVHAYVTFSLGNPADTRAAFGALAPHAITIGRNAMHGHVTFSLGNPSDTRAALGALAHHAIAIGRNAVHAIAIAALGYAPYPCASAGARPKDGIPMIIGADDFHSLFLQLKTFWEPAPFRAPAREPQDIKDFLSRNILLRHVEISSSNGFDSYSRGSNRGSVFNILTFCRSASVITCKPASDQTSKCLDIGLP